MQSLCETLEHIDSSVAISGYTFGIFEILFIVKKY